MRTCADAPPRWGRETGSPTASTALSAISQPTYCKLSPERLSIQASCNPGTRRQGIRRRTNVCCTRNNIKTAPHEPAPAPAASVRTRCALVSMHRGPDPAAACWRAHGAQACQRSRRARSRRSAAAAARCAIAARAALCPHGAAASCLCLVSRAPPRVCASSSWLLRLSPAWAL